MDSLKATQLDFTSNCDTQAQSHHTHTLLGALAKSKGKAKRCVCQLERQVEAYSTRYDKESVSQWH